MTISFQVSERFVTAAEDWADQRLMDTEEAKETKAEQALLEIEHLLSGATEVEFEVDGNTIHYEPSDEAEEFVSSRAGEAGVEESTLVRLYVDLFARVFLDDGDERPPNAPPT